MPPLPRPSSAPAGRFRQEASWIIGDVLMHGCCNNDDVDALFFFFFSIFALGIGGITCNPFQINSQANKKIRQQAVIPAGEIYVCNQFSSSDQPALTLVLNTDICATLQFILQLRYPAGLNLHFSHGVLLQIPFCQCGSICIKLPPMLVGKTFS